MTQTINSRSSLRTIKNMIEDDFGILITSAQAKEIRDSRLRNTSIWTASRYLNVAHNCLIKQIDCTGVKANAAKYSASEWNAAISNGEWD